MGMTQSKQEKQVATPETSATDTLEHTGLEAIVDNNNDDDSSSDSDEDEEEDEEFEEFMKERLRILEDSKNLKKVAEFFLHPEMPVKVDATACGRNYYSRPSAPEYEDEEETEERDRIMEDLAALKKYAAFYLKPELPVVTVPTAFGRNYFSRPSAPEYEDADDAEERERIMQDLAEMKKYAGFYRHPELPVITSDPTACGRNYFSRPSAPEYEDADDAEEREQVMEDVKMLKQNVGFYMHPEVPVVTSDPTACGRNYFTRPSAPAYEDEDGAEERERIMEDVTMLRRNADFYMHPEKPVAVDPTSFGRNYFSRASAEDKDTFFEAEQRNIILEEMKLAKKYATDYLHPELPVDTSDPTVFGRNYFSRPSAPEPRDMEEEEEKHRILEEMKLAKKYATDYLHPELPVVTSDPTVFGRNYFSRPSAPEPMDIEEEEEKHCILAEMKLAKKLATDYLHPELPVDTSDPTLFARNYFTRASAPEQEEEEDDDERAIILEEMAQLKKLAFDFDHPELLITSSDPTSCGRNYFNHDSARGVNEFVHHAHFDMDDDIHLHHVDFDKNTEYHEEITEIRHAVPGFVEKGSSPSKPGDDDAAGKLSSSPECVMFAHFKQPHHIV